MKIVSLKEDECFKRLFQNETVRKYFISDVLGIAVEKIKNVRLMNTELGRRYHNQKLGILDVVIEFNDDTRIDIELQLRKKKDWNRRQIFYLAQMYTAELLMGQDYAELKRSVLISITDFQVDGSKEYHHVYRLKNENGREFSDLLEIHTIELRKELCGTDPLDDWVRLFNAETKEDLDMIKTDNVGILTAIRELTTSPLQVMREIRQAKLKSERDRRAEDAYVRWEGKEEGREEGVCVLIKTLQDIGLSRTDTLQKVMKSFSLTEDAAESYMTRFWK